MKTHIRQLFSSILYGVLWLTQTPAQAGMDAEYLKDQAFQAAQYALSTSAGQAIALVGLRLAEGDDKLGALIKQHQQLAEQLRLADKQRLALLRGTDAARSASLRIRIQGIKKTLQGIEQQLQQNHPGYLEMTHPRPLAIAQVQSLLHADEVLVVSLVTARLTYLWAITREDSAWQRLEMGARELNETVKQLRTGLDPQSVLRGAARLDPAPSQKQQGFNRQLAYRLYQGIFAPFKALLEDKASLLMVADGALTSLPPSLLVVSPPKGKDHDFSALRKTDWLARHQAVTLLPTVSSLSSLRKKNRLKAAEEHPFIGFGAPLLAGNTAQLRGGKDTIESFYRDGKADVRAIKALPPLPATAGELRRLAKSLDAPDSSVMLAEQATETRLKAMDLAGTRIIAFATHGLLAGELSGLAEPALVLTPPHTATEQDDGLLTASEAARLHLNSEWVVLSACNTAASDGTPGAEGLSGLARAFLFAGTRALLVSHWPVRDDAAALLTSQTFAQLAQDPALNKAEAVRRARLALINSSTDSSLAHPASWAPFVVVGESSR